MKTNEQNEVTKLVHSNLNLSTVCSTRTELPSYVAPLRGQGEECFPIIPSLCLLILHLVQPTPLLNPPVQQTSFISAGSYIHVNLCLFLYLMIFDCELLIFIGKLLGRIPWILGQMDFDSGKNFIFFLPYLLSMLVGPLAKVIS